MMDNDTSVIPITKPMSPPTLPLPAMIMFINTSEEVIIQYFTITLKGKSVKKQEKRALLIRGWDIANHTRPLFCIKMSGFF